MCVCALAVIVGIPPCSKMSLMKTQASEGDDVVGNQRSESRKKKALSYEVLQSFFSNNASF